jgi:uncharacterized protein YciI
MLAAVIARDKPGHLETRKATRAAHLAYIEATGIVRQAGPLIEEGEMRGSLIILETATLAEAQDWVAADPYGKAGLFASVEVIEWKKVIG